MDDDEQILAIEVRLLLEAIHARHGYDLRSYAPSFMDRRLRAAVSKLGLRNLAELQHHVLHDHSFFFMQLLDELSIRVTDMFRDPAFFVAFREVVAPLLRTYPLLRIWHAGCATGEEVYASAIVLQEEGLYDRCQIYATDMSPRALEQAKQGVYALTHAPEFERNYVAAGGLGSFASYYTEAYEQMAMKESIRRNLYFFEHNLVSDQVFGEMHVVFCRNVLIYFDPELKARVIEKFAQSLRSGGLLCLGASERLTRTDQTRFGFRELAPDARIYRYDAQGGTQP